MITNRYHFNVLDSTNKKAKELAEQGCKHGTLVTAEEQEAGVGRRGRSWSSQKGTGIYMSMVLKPQLEIQSLSMITLLAAMAVAKAFEQLQILSENTPCIKWPNDIVINKKKICGILTELNLKGRDIDSVIVGIGINVSNTYFPGEIKEMASSILLETGKTIDKELLIQSVWKNFSSYYERFSETQDLSLLKEEYETYLLNKGERVKVLEPVGEYEGIAGGITNKGELLVDINGKEKAVSSGEVSVRGIYGYV